LDKWWEIESSPSLLEKMEKEQVKDENGDIVNMIGALTVDVWTTLGRHSLKIIINNIIIIDYYIFYIISK
jgi:hypothetical protein